MTPQLRQRRTHLLTALRRLDGQDQHLLAARHYALLTIAQPPTWLDMEHIADLHADLQATKTTAALLHQDAAYRARHGLQPLWDATLDRLHPILAWRLLDPTSPDRHRYWSRLIRTLPHLSLALGTPEDDPALSHLPLVPNPDAPLSSLFDIWVTLQDDAQLFSDVALWMEEEAITTVLADELARTTLPQTPDMHAMLARWVADTLLLAPGAWMGDNAHSIATLTNIYGDAHYSAGLLLMMRKAQALMTEVHSLGGDRILAILEENRLHRFALTADNAYRDDPTGWVDLSARACAILGMSNDGSLILERYRGLSVDKPIRDVYAAALGDTTWFWLDAEQCRAVHAYSVETGQALPMDPGRLYRGFAQP